MAEWNAVSTVLPPRVCHRVGSHKQTRQAIAVVVVVVAGVVGTSGGCMPDCFALWMYCRCNVET